MPTDAMDVNAGALTNVVDEKIEPVSEKGVVPHFGSNGSDDGHDIYPTVEELNLSTGLRRISAPIPWAVYTIAFVELCERFSYYGTQVVCMLPCCNSTCGFC
jgi:POT family proton-dependent oligopeptide transporter